MRMLTRDFTVATFVRHGGRLLCLRHNKLGLWLPPGGHIEPHELPDEAAVREVKEETGVDVVLTSLPRHEGPPAGPGEPRPLARPEGVQLEDIGPDHQHVDLIYFAEVAPGADPAPRGNGEGDAVGWYTLAELQALGATEEVLGWGRLALRGTPGPSTGE